MIFESHAHYDDEAFDEDREVLLASMQENGIERVINVCAEVENWQRTIVLMEKYSFVYGCATATTPFITNSLRTSKNPRFTGLSVSLKWQERKNCRLLFTAGKLHRIHWTR